MTLEELSRAIAEGTYSCSELTMEALQRIAANDQDGKCLNTVTALNTQALMQARAIDEEIQRYGRRSPLHGIPVLVKDNIDCTGFPTTAGSLALADNYPRNDAEIVRRLKEAGALILGKANLSEFAYFMSRQNMPSGYSSYSGQVVHAYVPGIDPSGSSSGSAVAVSARFVPYAIGTETDGSLMSPAAANAIVSIKPTVGLVSADGILPLSPVQDTAGPMCLSVQDAADVLQVIVREEYAKDYRASLGKDASGLCVGIVRQDCDEQALAALDHAEAILQDAGISVKDVHIDIIEQDELECLMHEFKQSINAYLHQSTGTCKSLSDIIAFNNAHADQCLRYGQDLLEESNTKSGRLLESEYIRLRTKLTSTARAMLEGTLEKENIDILLSAGDGPKGNLAPISGDPCMILPAVIPDPSDYKPCSWHLTAGPFQEDILLRIAYILEQGAAILPKPDWCEEFEA
ncbi:MAG: hypothetical protein IKS37_01150 [Solobacterium sp.]|nr:hypothetical protein [Solobacterium sp.]